MIKVLDIKYDNKEPFGSKENGMELLNVEETAELLKLKVSTLYSWVHKNKIPHIKIGGALRFDINDIKRFVENNRVN